MMAGVSSHIDYVSVTLPYPAWYSGVGEVGEAVAIALGLLWLWPQCDIFSQELSLNESTVREGLHGFRRRVTWDSTGVAVQWGAGHGRFHVVLSGQGCLALNEALPSENRDAAWSALFAAPAANWTRIDVAADVLADDLPRDVVRLVESRAGTSHSFIESATGETCTVGSRSSDVYLRIYRYWKPHPRADRLRWEWELKGDAAREAARRLGSGEDTRSLLAALVERSNVSYAPLRGYISPTPSDRLAWARREASSKLLWLYKVCLPALKRGIQDGGVPKEDVLKYLGLDE